MELNICPTSGNEDQLVELEGLDEECSFKNEEFKTLLTSQFES